MSKATHQLVVQIPEAALADFDALVAFEDLLHELLGDRHEVDGHDIGSGEANFFVLTDDPVAALSDIRDGAGHWLARPDVRVAARLITGDDYAVLWPRGDARPFTLR